MKSDTPLSAWTRKHLHIQGYTKYTDTELQELKYGIRFAYLGCGSLVVLGLVLQNTAILGAAMLIAFLAIVLPRHPIDYLYNSLVRHMLNKPPAPLRTAQGKFACGVATVWIGLIIFLISSSFTLAANLLGSILILQAFVVGTIDFCVPSMIYNGLARLVTRQKLQEG